MDILNKKIALLKSKVEKNETITIMIIGLGSVGTFLLDFLVSLRDPQLKIVVAGRNAAKMQMDVNIVRTAATIRRELRSQIEILGDCDLNDVDSIAATIKTQLGSEQVESKHVRNFTINFKTTDAANAFAQIANQYQDIIEAYSNCNKGYAVEGDAHYCCGRI